jgi:serine O-acetyltransferase
MAVKMQFVLRLHRLSACLEARKISVLSRFVDLISRILFAGSIPGRARIGERVFFHHSALGVVINGHSVIEDDCEIGVHVVLGGRSPQVGAPHLQRRVIVHAGARLIGPICIGEGSVIGANAVVLSDVPPRSLVVGVPGVVKRSDIDNRTYVHTGLEV